MVRSTGNLSSVSKTLKGVTARDGIVRIPSRAYIVTLVYSAGKRVQFGGMLPHRRHAAAAESEDESMFYLSVATH